MNAIDIIGIIQTALGWIATAALSLYFFMPVYTVVGFFTTRNFPKAKKKHKYAVMIAARNEEAVIGNLIDSINNQDYPSELVTVFVVADNCSDNTADIARGRGAVCYERFDADRRTKGYALEFLVEQIRKDYGIESFDAYFIFDADNLLKKDYISRMNEAFDSGEKIVTSYRNTKNFSDNWIAASYGIHWLRTIRHEHRGRSFFRLASRVQGTGFMFASEVIKDGWHYVSFTEDRAFAADAVVNGYSISYCNSAEFFDEQPTSLRIALRQRLRWAKGHLQAFAESGPKLMTHVFTGVENKTSVNIWQNIRGRFMSYDMFTITFPNSLVSIILSILEFLLICVMIVLAGQNFDLSPLEAFASSLVTGYLGNVLIGAYVLFMERKRIIKFSFLKKVFYCIMWPMFDIIGKFSVLSALFVKVEWKPIPHNVDVCIEELSDK